MVKLTLPTDSAARKDVPVLRACLNYFPAAIAAVARISMIGDRKHNPENTGAPFHARGKSMDHGDCIVRHTMDMEDLKALIMRDKPLIARLHPAVPKLLEEAGYRAWRALADYQELAEQYADVPLAPAARLPEGKADLAEALNKSMARRGAQDALARAPEMPDMPTYRAQVCGQYDANKQRAPGENQIRPIDNDKW
jgi:hypothetical protein